MEHFEWAGSHWALQKPYDISASERARNQAQPKCHKGHDIKIYPKHSIARKTRGCHVQGLGYTEKQKVAMYGNTDISVQAVYPVPSVVNESAITFI